MTEIQQAMWWLQNGSTGLSSKAIMATILNGGKVGDRIDSRAHPIDPSDLNRCVMLLDAVPSFRDKLWIMKPLSDQWAVLVDHWEELENLLKEEKKASPHSAPKTYLRMKELFRSVGDHSV